MPRSKSRNRRHAGGRGAGASNQTAGHQRDTTGAKRPQLDLLTGLRRLQAEGGGVLRKYLIGFREFLPVLIGAEAGDSVCLHLRTAMEDAQRKVLLLAATEPVPCFVCPAEILDPVGCTYIVVMAHADHRNTGLSGVICPGCGSLRDLDARTEGAIRRLWPDLRSIMVTHPGGGRA